MESCTAAEKNTYQAIRKKVLSKKLCPSANSPDSLISHFISQFESTRFSSFDEDLLEAFHKMDSLTTIKSIKPTIQRHTALAARIMRMANSPLYGFPQRVEALSHALVILGIDAVKGLILLHLYSPQYQKLPFALRKIANKVNRHSLKTLEILSEKVIPHSFFTCRQALVLKTGAVIHDIGKLIMLPMIPDDEADEWLSLDGDSWLEKEKEMFGFTHTSIGKYIADKWNLPPSLSSIVTCHHSPESAPEDWKDMVEAVYEANQMAYGIHTD